MRAGRGQQSGSAHGFTLVELVAVIILAGILAVTIGGRFFSGSDIDVYAARELLLGHLRRLQLDALNNSAGCFQMLLLTDRYGPPDLNPCTASAGFSPGYFDGRGADPYRASLLDGDAPLNLPAGRLDLRFDRWGRPAGDCAGGCTLTFNGAISLQLRIEAEGYIHVL